MKTLRTDGSLMTKLAAGLDAEAIERITNSVNQVQQALDNPAERTAIKLASVKPPASLLSMPTSPVDALKKVGVLAGMIGGAAILGDTLSSAYHTIREGSRRKARFEAMLEANPDLGVSERYDPRKIKMVFNTVSRFNPDVASDPYASGSIVRQMYGYEGGSLNDIKTLSDAYGKHRSNKDVSGATKLLGALNS